MSESFEKWYKSKGCHIMFNDVGDMLAKHSYTAALERAAEIAELMTSRMDIVYDENTESIAAAIRKELEK